jgi:hypothetical protein
MGGALYCRPSDIVAAGEVTWSVAAGVISTDPNYDLTALMSRIPACPVKFTTAVQAEIVGNFGSAHRVDGVLFPSHNFAANLGVRVQMNATNSWGAPTVDALLDVDAARPDGHSRHPWIDLRTVAGYSVGGFQYIRILAPAMAVAPQFGGFTLVEQWRTFGQGLFFKLTEVQRRAFIHSFLTAAGVKSRYALNVKQYGISAGGIGTIADYRDLLDLHDDAIGIAPFVFVLDSAVKNDGGYLVTFSDELLNTLQADWQEGPNVINLTLAFDEVSSGLPL